MGQKSNCNMLSSSFWMYMLCALLVIFLLRAMRPRRHRFDCEGQCIYNYRQGNIFTISDDASLNAGGNYADFFYVEPNSEEAARIRAQLEKDDKELPSYEEVMGMNNLATPTAGIGPDATTSAATVGTNTNTTTATIAALPAEVPPYSEVDPLSTTRAQGVSTVPSSSAGSVVITIPDEAAGSCAVPSTSRAAAAAAAAGTTTTTTTASIPIINSSSNTTV